MRPQQGAPGARDSQGAISTATNTGSDKRGGSILPRPTLTLKSKAPIAVAAPQAAPIESVQLDAEVSYLNWKVGNRRPSRRYLTAEAALAEARRLKGLDPNATIYAYRVTLVREVAP